MMCRAANAHSSVLNLAKQVKPAARGVALYEGLSHDGVVERLFLPTNSMSCHGILLLNALFSTKRYFCNKMSIVFLNECLVNFLV